MDGVCNLAATADHMPFLVCKISMMLVRIRSLFYTIKAQDRAIRSEGKYITFSPDALIAGHYQSSVLRKGIRVLLVCVWGIRELVEALEEGFDPICS